MSWYLQVLKKYAVFSGRARRKEYWYFILFDSIITFVLWLIPVLVVLGSVYSLAFLPTTIYSLAGVPTIIYSLAVLLPSIGVSIRRLHDTGRSGWWLFIGLIPLAGPIILLIYMVSDSQAGINKYGPSPKLVEQQPLS